MIHKTYQFMKLAAANVLRYSGMLSYVLDKNLSNRVLVLTYHRVIDDKYTGLTNSSPGIIVSKSVFEMHIRNLRAHFNVISLEDLLAYFEDGRSLPKRSCLVTFDDGWIDNYETAFPVLTQFEVPAAIFLPTAFISGDSVFWQEEVQRSLLMLLSSDREKDRSLFRDILGLRDTTSNITTEDIRHYISTLKQQSDIEIDRVLDRLRDALKTRPPPEHYDRYMTWRQIREMKSNGISFGSHAVSHRILTHLTDEQCRDELADSRAVLEDRLGCSIQTLAYPNGNHDERVMRFAERAGYKIAFTTRGGYLGTNCNRLSIPRNNIHDQNSQSAAQFLCTCAKIF